MDKSQKILSDIVVFQKYAKHVRELNRREVWSEICDRNKEMHKRKYPQLAAEIDDVYSKFVYTRKVLPSMRSMQFGGRPIELSNNRMFNCAFSNADHPAIFWETMFNLLSGSGCGYSVQTRHISQLPVVQGPSDKNRRFLVGDSIEGWADAIRVLVRAYFEGKSDPLFDYRDIRPKGARLVTSGGKAPGPDPLRICIEKIRAVLNGAICRHLTSLEIHDILCHIADAVLSGGIRRAAMIVLFDKNDMDMLYCKSGSWWELNPQRGRANNSVILERGGVTKQEFDVIWEVVKNSGAGEPGVVWADDMDSGVNPCVTGDTLVTVTDHGTTIGGEMNSVGVTYQIPMKMLVDLYETTEMPPMVVSYNVSTGKTEVDYLDAAALTRKHADVIKLTMDDGTFIKVTPDHKIFTENRGWIQAKDLTETDVIISIN